MKKLILMEFLKLFKSKPDLMRRLKVFALFAFVGIFAATGAVIWAGVTAMNHVISHVDESTLLPTASVGELVTSAESVRTNVSGCLGQVQDLLMPQVWLERPLLENVKDLSQACLNTKATSCVGEECSEKTSQKT